MCCLVACKVVYEAALGEKDEMYEEDDIALFTVAKRKMGWASGTD